MELLRLYRKPLLSEAMERNLIRNFYEQVIVSRGLTSVHTETCYYLELTQPLRKNEFEILAWLLSETFEPGKFSKDSFLGDNVIEVGPRMNFVTSWCTNAIQEISQVGISYVTRIERSRRYKPITTGYGLSDETIQGFIALVHDTMTEQHYPEPLRTFETDVLPEPMKEIPLIQKGPDALKEAGKDLGLALDQSDIDYIYNYFAKKMGRNPTDVEIFQYGQANSDHSRHHGFRGVAIIDGNKRAESLMDMIKKPFILNPGKTLIGFKDNASASGEYEIKMMVPSTPGRPSPLRTVKIIISITFNAETHCHPCFIAAREGAETGIGGRVRDDIAPGKGALIGGNTSLYMVGNLFIPGHELAWEKITGDIPPGKMKPLDILIEASNGASDYANKFGIPLIGGGVRSFDMRVPSRERRAYLKPIMFTGGMGMMDKRHLRKDEPEAGMKVVLLGGPGYRIGIGGGSASSMGAGENVEELDFNSVQRGDAEMERRVYNVVDTCVKMGKNTPIRSIHDLGAGGTCNAITEIGYPAGALIYLNKIPLGDETLSKLETWGNESQERMVILVDDKGLETMKVICEREKCPFAVVGEITGDGRFVVIDERDSSKPVDIGMDFALGDVPKKTFHDTSVEPVTQRLEIPIPFGIETALEMVLSHPDVASKQYLTVKADRSVGGRVVRQQCCGPLHLPLADYSLIAHSFFDNTGTASSIGQMPIQGLINMEAMARMSLSEAITNIMFANVESLEEINLCVNAMWAAYKKGEISNLHSAYKALTDLQIKLGIRTDGGKDSSSMYAVANDPEGNTEDVKAPGTLVISARGPCLDISKGVTPDIKLPGKSRLMYIDFSREKKRLGGSIFARILDQLGDKTPDLENPEILKAGFNTIHEMLQWGLILSGHDVSDGGVITTICEMAFGGNCGFTVNLGSFCSKTLHGSFSILFSEEPGVVIEYLPKHEWTIQRILGRHNLLEYSHMIGKTTEEYISIRRQGHYLLRKPKNAVRMWWEKTSFMLDKLQANPECVEEEMKNRTIAKSPIYSLPKKFHKPGPVLTHVDPRVAVIREEGTNAHEEMQAGFVLAGFEVWDVTMSDIIHKRMRLENVQMVVFPGGFSFGDVLDAGKGWAGTILFNEHVRAEFERFYKRNKTLSFGVCNGCQLMSLIGWVPWKGISMEKQPRFIRNTSERFECRFPIVKIQESPAVMLKDMAGSVMGIWVRHGEGRFRCEDDLMKHIERRGLAPIRFCDDSKPTERYPFNPNGSPNGITAICSPDGRHLAMMPHPEALLRMEVWPWVPPEWSDVEESPWMRMFHNARAFFG